MGRRILIRYATKEVCDGISWVISPSWFNQKPPLNKEVGSDDSLRREFWTSQEFDPKEAVIMNYTFNPPKIEIKQESGDMSSRTGICVAQRRNLECLLLSNYLGLFLYLSVPGLGCRMWNQVP